MTDIITVDFETFYSKEVGFSKLTTEEYVRHPEFHVIGVSVKVNNGPTEWASGTHAQLQAYFNEFDWGNSLVLAHNTKFDGAILSWHFGITPKAWLDTLSMARAIHGVEVGGSLAKLAQRYDLGEKGTEVVNALGKRRLDFTEEELSRYGDYCINDVELTYKLFNILVRDFPKKELKLIDLTLRMFTHPTLVLDKQLLRDHLVRVTNAKADLLQSSGFTDRKALMSNNKFADALRDLGVTPPTKISTRTGKTTYAFAKTDQAFLDLQEHEDGRVQTLVAARLGIKSTLEETRTQRFLDISERGLMPVPIRYYAAHTGRWGGDDKINLQNLPARGPNAKTLKRAIMAPDSYIIYDCDSAQIEARVLAWLAGQADLVQAFTNGEDVYIDMASAIYGVAPQDVTKAQRFVGKTTILGCGYGMGAARFKDQLASFGVEVPIEEAKRIVQIYRRKNKAIVDLWYQANVVLEALYLGKTTTLGVMPVVTVLTGKRGIRLPSGLIQRYDNLQREKGEKGYQYTYSTRSGRTKIYGGKLVENVVQGIARCIIGEQMLHIAKRYRPVLTVHDSIGSLVPALEAEKGKEYIDTCMRRVPSWAEGLPVDCEGFGAVRYGDCDENNPALVV